MLVLAYILSTMTDKPGMGGFTVQYGTSDATYSSNGLFYVDLKGTEEEIKDSLRLKVAEAVNTALGLHLTSEDVRLF